MAKRTVSAFLNKLYEMVNDSSTDHILRWASDGECVVIENHELFCEQLLPQYFKHSNFSSFSRQLNFYQFKKVSKPQTEKAKQRGNRVVFRHPCFKKGRLELLRMIKRRTGTTTEPTPKQAVETLRQEVTTLSVQLRDLQQNVQALSSSFSTLCEVFHGAVASGSFHPPAAPADDPATSPAREAGSSSAAPSLSLRGVSLPPATPAVATLHRVPAGAVETPLDHPQCGRKRSMSVAQAVPATPPTGSPVCGQAAQMPRMDAMDSAKRRRLELPTPQRVPGTASPSGALAAVPGASPTGLPAAVAAAVAAAASTGAAARAPVRIPDLVMPASLTGGAAGCGSMPAPSITAGSFRFASVNTPTPGGTGMPLPPVFVNRGASGVSQGLLSSTGAGLSLFDDDMMAASMGFMGKEMGGDSCAHAGAEEMLGLLDGEALLAELEVLRGTNF